MHEAVGPGRLDQRPPYVLTHRKVHVQSVVGGVPLWHPDVGEGLVAKTKTQLTKELADVGAQLALVVTALASKGQGAKTVELVGCAVASNPALGTSCGFLGRALGINRMALNAKASCVGKGGDECAAAFAGIRI